MRRRQGRVNRWVLFTLAVLALIFVFLEGQSRRTVRSRFYETKIKAAELTRQAFELVRNYRLKNLSMPIDSVNDPNSTGLVGLYSSSVVYGRSDLSDALTTTNVNFSAALVELFLRAGVKKGDTIAVNWDGTYPALNIAVLAVARTFGLEPVIVTAQSSGMWGANYPGWTWLDIERVLVSSGIWNFKSKLATLGGEADDGRGLPPDGREILIRAAESAGVTIFVPQSISEGLTKRRELFSRTRLLVAVGMPVSNSGDPLLRLPSGLMKGRHRRAGSGIVAAFLEQGLPVIHIVKPNRVALDYRLPVAPTPLPELGEGRLFYERRYSVPLAILFAVILLILLFVVVRYDIESYFGIGEKEEKGAV